MAGSFYLRDSLWFANARVCPFGAACCGLFPTTKLKIIAYLILRMHGLNVKQSRGAIVWQLIGNIKISFLRFEYQILQSRLALARQAEYHVDG